MLVRSGRTVSVVVGRGPDRLRAASARSLNADHPFHAGFRIPDDTDYDISADPWLWASDHRDADNHDLDQLAVLVKHVVVTRSLFTIRRPPLDPDRPIL